MPHTVPDEDFELPADLENGVTVEVCNLQNRLGVSVGEVARMAEAVLSREGVEHASISIALVDNATIRKLNRDRLGHDWDTDVISFLLSEPDAPELSGELIVSAEMARQTAEETRGDPGAELSLYVVHGLLHLCGYDDIDHADALTMRAREDHHLRSEGLINPFPLAEGPRSAVQERGHESWSA
jgi:probable rRNA maturation factor